MTFDPTKSAQGPNSSAAAQLRMMSAAHRLDRWDAQELADAASVSVPTARAFGSHDGISSSKVATGGRPKSMWQLTARAREEIEFEVASFYQQCLRLAIDRAPNGKEMEVREMVSRTFDTYFDGIDYEQAAASSKYDPEDVIEVFQGL